MKILALSDKTFEFIYSPAVAERFPDVDWVISCGDLPYYYIEYVVDVLNVPTFFVRGNHASVVEYGQRGNRTAPMGAVDLHAQVASFNGVLMAGIEGSLRYREGPFMYTQNDMWVTVLGMVPRLLINRLVYGRYLDLLITHSPPNGVHDRDDIAHQGFKAINWLIKVFKPKYHLHGHIHLYNSNAVRRTRFEETEVINVYGYQELELDLPYKPGK
jgi:Icc-related predicted phosphoesterase